MSLNQRIKGILKEEKVSQAALAEELQVTDSAVNQLLNSNKEIDSLAFVKAVAKLTGRSVLEVVGANFFDFFNGTEGFDKPRLVPVSNQSGKTGHFEEETSKYLAGNTIRVVTATVDKHGNDLMVYVPVKAQAGYLRGYGDPHYLEKLPAFSLPILKTGQYRMFEADGDSMLQMGGGGLHNGDIVIGQYVEDVFEMKDNRVYVVISTEGLCIKRCLNRLQDKSNPVLVCKSDNKSGSYPDIIIRPHQIKEVWELKAYISKQLGFATDIWEVLSNMEVKIAMMDDKLKKIEEDKLLPG